MKKTVLLALLILPLLTCSEPTALLDKLEDDVKGANDLYLEIVDFSPAENGQYINPGEDIRIEFDRPIDLASVKDAFTVIDSDKVLFGSDSVSKSLSYSFDENTNILTINADPYLDGLKQYTISILKGIRGRDGSALREEKQWSFSTSDSPRGYVEFVEDYTNDATPDIHIFSQGATYYTISTTEGGISWSTDYQLTGNPTVVSDIDMSGADGTRNIYVQFRDGFVGQAGIANLSAIESDSMVYDTTDPTVSLPATIYGNIANPSPSLNPTVSDNLSGIGTYAWSTLSSATFGNASSVNSTVSATGDGNYSIRLTVTDRAGNSDFADMTYTRDTSAPTLPTFSSSPNNTLSTITKPTLTFTSNSDIAGYQYRKGNEAPDGKVSWGSWISFSPVSGSSGYVLDLGTTAVQIRGWDAASNYSSSQQFSYKTYSSSAISPANGATITGDLVWPHSSPYQYKVYVGTSSRGSNPEIPLYSGIFKVRRTQPFVDISELSLLLGTTYYWHVEIYPLSTTKTPTTSPVYSFKTSKFKF